MFLKTFSKYNRENIFRDRLKILNRFGVKHGPSRPFSVGTFWPKHLSVAKDVSEILWEHL